MRNGSVHLALFTFGFFDSRKKKIPQDKTGRSAHFFPTETARHIKKIKPRAFLFFEEGGQIFAVCRRSADGKRVSFFEAAAVAQGGCPAESKP